MNPEFLRNLWLEASPFRLALIAGLLLLVFSAEVVSMQAPAGLSTIGQTATMLYFFFTVLWGTRNAALAVVGEIRERTWDSQKLSAIGPVEMVWGKLFGATVQNWFGGLLCLAVSVWQITITQGPDAALTSAARLLLLGVLAQSVALLSSLMMIRRNTGNWRLDIFLCQVAGILAAYSFGSVLSTLRYLARDSGPLTWWGRTFDGNTFHLASLVLFTGWALVGCWRAMRAELRFSNGPFYWLAWLAFIFVYQAGFESMLPHRLDVAQLHGTVLRVALGGLAILGSAYGMAFLEPKDPVRMRWLEEQVAAGRLWRAFLALDAWMLSYAATLAVGVVLAVLMLTGGGVPGWALAVLAMLGFLTRDVSIFVLLRSRAGGRGDFAALAVLGALYILLPMLVHGGGLTVLFLPVPGSLLSLLAAWAQGMGLALWARQSMRAKA